MAKTGRPKKPTALKRLEGNPGKRPLPADEPEFRTASAHHAPEWLSPVARDEWDRLAPELVELGLLTNASLRIFAGYCQSYAHWRAAEEWMAEHGRTIVMRDRDGRVTGVREVPQSKIAKEERENMRKFASEFGLTPSTAAGVVARKKEEKKDDLDFLVDAAGSGASARPN